LELFEVADMDGSFSMSRSI
jgi:hypothetical protein